MSKTKPPGSETPTEPDITGVLPSYDSEEALAGMQADFENAVKTLIFNYPKPLTPLLAASVLGAVAAELLVKLGLEKDDVQNFFTEVDRNVREVLTRLEASESQSSESQTESEPSHE